MRRFLTALALSVLLAAPASAENGLLCRGDVVEVPPGGKPPWQWDWSTTKKLDLSPDECAKFDEALRSLYREDCDCYLFDFMGKPHKFEAPLTPKKRFWLFEHLRNRQARPIVPPKA